MRRARGHSFRKPPNLDDQRYVYSELFLNLFRGNTKNASMEKALALYFDNTVVAARSPLMKLSSVHMYAQSPYRPQ